MADQFQWPQELDEPLRLLNVVGSFWSQVYSGSDLVASLLHAKARLQDQAHLDLLDLIAATSRFDVPVFHFKTWSLLLVKESEQNSPNIAAFDGTLTFDGTAQFGVPGGSPLLAWLAPTGLADALVVTTAITGTPTLLTRGIDFFLRAGALWFRTDPFSATDAVVTEIVAADGTVTDRIAALWIYRGAYDRDTTYDQFGYVVGRRLPSSVNYRAYVNAQYDALVEGTTARAVEDLMSAICDVPLAGGDETVVYVTADARYKWVITDKAAYRFSPAANVLVKPGEAVEAGQPLTDALIFHDFNRGTMPAAVSGLTLGRGLLAAAFVRELVFVNADTPLRVDAADGYTRVEFSLAGWPGDVDRFWEDVHAAGVAAGDTLAMRLDDRTNRLNQPTASALPATINPAAFLAANVLRGNAFAIIVRPTAFGPAALGLAMAAALRKIVPPQVVCLLFVALDLGPDTVTMDGPGDAAAPGYEEDVDSYSGVEVAEAVDPSVSIGEEIRAFQIDGYCS